MAPTRNRVIYLFILLYLADSTADMCPGKKITEITEIS